MCDIETAHSKWPTYQVREKEQKKRPRGDRAKKNDRRKGGSEKTKPNARKDEMMSKGPQQTECAISLGKCPEMNHARSKTDDRR